MPKWLLLGAGRFNVAYVDCGHKEVIKFQKGEGHYQDTPERCVRIWNLINAKNIEYQPAQLVKVKHPKTGEMVVAWTCPYINGEQASDPDIQQALIDIYLRTGRIVLDAVARRNFINTGKKTICVDPGMAVRLNPSDPCSLKRDESMMSLDAWAKGKNYDDFFEINKDFYPKTISTIKALIFINDYQPRMDVRFLIKDSKEAQYWRLRYADGYKGLLPFRFPIQVIPSKKESKHHILEGNSPKEKNDLESKKSSELDKMKKDCRVVLNSFIHSQGEYDRKKNKFIPYATFFFKDAMIVAKEVYATLYFKNIMNAATTFNELKIYLTIFLMQLSESNELAATINHCLEQLHPLWKKEVEELPAPKTFAQKLSVSSK